MEEAKVVKRMEKGPDGRGDTRRRRVVVAARAAERDA